MKPTPWLVGVLVVAVAAAGGYVWIERESPGEHAPTDRRATMTLATSAGYAGTALVHIASSKGFFEREGLDVTLQPHASGSAAFAAVLAGRADLATVSDVAYVQAASGSGRAAIVATIFRAENDHGIVGRADRGFRVLGDINGKRIGVTNGTSGDFVLDGFLLRQGLSREDVSVQSYPPDQLESAIARGEVDAVVSWEPVLGAIRRVLGSDAAVFYAGEIYELTFNLAGLRDYVASDPEAIRRLLQALVRAEDFVRDRPEEARELVREMTGMDEEQLAEQWANLEFEVRLEQSLLVTLEDITRWATHAGLVSPPSAPNYLEHIYLEGLLAVSPDDVTVIH